MVLGALPFLKPSPIPSNPAPHSVLNRWSCRVSAVFTVVISTPTLSSASYTQGPGPLPSDPVRIQQFLQVKAPATPSSHPCICPLPLSSLLHLPHHPEIICSHVDTLLFLDSPLLVCFVAPVLPERHTENFTCATSPDSPEVPVMPLRCHI